MSEQATETGWSALLQPVWLSAVSVLVAGVLLHSMNVLMLATVLPSVVQEVGGAARMSWTSTAFLASSIVAATCTGYLSTVMGPRLVYCAGALGFGGGALLCALAESMDQVVAGRFLQGFGGGLLIAMAYVLVRNTFPQALWARAFALISGAWSLSILVGPMVGGLFARYGHWRGAFFAVAGIACFLGVVALRALPPSASIGKGSGVPWGRVAMICGAIAALSLGAIAPAAAAKAGLFAASVVLLVLMLAADRRAARPLLPTDAFSWRSQTGVALWLVLLVAVAYSPLQIYVAVFLQGLHGLDPLSAGYMVAGASFGWTGMSLVVAGAAPHRADRLLVAGPLLMALGLAGMALLMSVDPPLVVLPAIVVTGAGIGGCWAFVAQRVMTGARPGEEDLAASAVATVQQTGFAFGAGLAGMVANAAGLSAGLDRAGLAAAALWVPSAFVAVAVVGALAARRLVRQPAPAAAP